MPQTTAVAIDQLAINTIRFLAVDMVEKGEVRATPARRSARRRWPTCCGRAACATTRAPGLAGPRPLRALLRPRLGAALRAAPSHRLRPADGAARALPPDRLADPGAPRARADAGRRDHHRSARPGLRQRGRHGDGARAAGGALQPAGPAALRLPHLGLRQRRRSHGGRGVRGRVARRAPAALQPQGLLRRQRDLDRRPDLARLHRGRRPPLRGLRLARGAGRRRQRPRRAGGRDGDRRGGERAPDAGRGAHPHRLRQPEEAGHRRRARRAARTRGDQGDQGEPRLAARADVPHSRGGAAALRAGRRARRRAGAGMERAAAALGRGPPRPRPRSSRGASGASCPTAGIPASRASSRARRSRRATPRARCSTRCRRRSRSWSAARPT